MTPQEAQQKIKELPSKYQEMYYENLAKQVGNSRKMNQAQSGQKSQTSEGKMPQENSSTKKDTMTTENPLKPSLSENIANKVKGMFKIKRK